jgi:hypothetical protein
MSSTPSLQRAILTRDAFLETVARKLESRLEGASDHRRAKAGDSHAEDLR